MHRKGFTNLASRSKFRNMSNEATCTEKALLISPQGQSSENMSFSMRQHAQERLYSSRLKVKVQKYVHFNEATCIGKALLISPQGQSLEIISTSMRQHAQERLNSSRLKVKVQKICPLQ